MELSGVIPANILPMRDDLSIDEGAYRKHVDGLAATDGVGAITCNGHAAEVASLSRNERRGAVQVACEAVDGRVPVIAGIYAENHLQAIELAMDAESEGASALLVFPLPALALGGDGAMAYRYVAELASAVSLPLVVFSYGAATAMGYDLDTLADMCSIDTVCAVKEWSLDIGRHERTAALIRELPRHVSLLTSFSTHLLPALISGADGILSGHGSVIASLQTELLRLVRTHDLDAASHLYQRIQYLTSVVYRAPMANMYARMKEHLVMLGYDLAPVVRPPLYRVGDAERRELWQALVNAQLLPGGCR